MIRGKFAGDTQFNSSDVWLLQVIIHCTYEDRKATLYDLVSVGDGINHSIITAGELQSGIHKFIRSGLVTWSDGYLATTAKLRDGIGHRITQKTGLMMEREILEKLLGASPWKANESLETYKPDSSPFLFSIEDYQKSLNDYQELAKKLIANILKKRTRK